MKNFLLLISMYCISTVSIAQNVDDVETIFNLCINQTELLPQNHLSNDGVTKVVVVDNDVLPIGISAYWFDVPVQFNTEAQIAAANIPAFIQFNTFEILSPRQAKVTYTYICNGDCTTYTYELEFTKYTQFWTISRNKTIARSEIRFSGFSKSGI